MQIFALFLLLLCVVRPAWADSITLKETPFTLMARIHAVAPDGKRWQLILKPQMIEGLEGEMPRKLRCLYVTKDIIPAVGAMVELEANIKRPAPPAYPGGFDWQRWLYDQGIDATCFVYSQLLVVRDEHQPAFWQRQWYALQQWRLTLAQQLYNQLGQTQTAAMASALVTGADGYLNKYTEDTMRLAGLTHIISISGLHMTIVAGFAYVLFRYMLALTPLVFRYPIKKWAAAFGLLVAAGYLMISGLSIPAQRSFIATAVVFVAILLDRRPFSLWTLFLAALTLMCIDPHAVFNPGFQLSFLAVLTLILFYDKWGKIHWQEVRWRALKNRLFRHISAIVLTTVLITMVGAPVTAYHFGTVALYGALSNVIAIPLSSILIMPALFMAVALMPLGLGSLPLKAAGMGISLMLHLAEAVSKLKGVQVLVPSMPALSAIVLLAAVAVLLLARRWWKIVSMPMLAAGVWWAGQQPLPLLLLNANGQQFGVVQQEGLEVYARKRDNTTPQRWAQYLGFAKAVRREVGKPEKMPAHTHCEEGGCTIALKTPDLTVAWFYTPQQQLPCGQVDVVIASAQALTGCGRLATIDAAQLDGQGAAAFFWQDATHTLTLVTDRQTRGDAPWAYYQ